MRITGERLFVDLTEEEARELRDFAESVVMQGSIPNPVPQWARDWVDQFAPKSGLLGFSTALPLHVLMSVVRHQEATLDYAVKVMEEANANLVDNNRTMRKALDDANSIVGRVDKLAERLDRPRR